MALYGRNISPGAESASAFGLLRGRWPRILPLIDDTLRVHTSTESHVQATARRKLGKMLRSRVHQSDSIKVEDSVLIRRDGSGWLYCAHVTLTVPYFHEIVHNGRVRASGLNRACLLRSATHDENYSRVAQGGSHTQRNKLIYIPQQSEYAIDHTVEHDEPNLALQSMTPPRLRRSSPPMLSTRHP